MHKNSKLSVILYIASASTAIPGTAAFSFAQTPSLTPKTMPRVGAVDERFQSYNIEMVEVTGGRFWKPYTSQSDAAPKPPSGNQPTGMDPNLYEYRPPIDLANPRLRKLAAALGPAYVRVSGTWANTTYFQNSDEPAATTPPQGFNGVLTRQEWKGVVDFSKATNAELVTSFAISPGARDASGVWTPDQAQQIVDYTNSLGGRIAAAEFFNEPNIASIGGAPKGYDAAAYGRDVTVFHAWARKAVPDMIFLGPGSVAESTQMVPSAMHLLTSADLLTATGPAFDAISYHSYCGVSSRCGMFGAASTTTEAAALSDEWLARPETILAFYGQIRDRFEPGKPLWLTETAQTACGGDRWASTFLDSFRYLNQLGTLARHGVQVHMHNTLAASDYGLLDEHTYEPRPNYWSALLWHKLMGSTVLDPGPSPATSLRLYAQCMKSHPGGVVILAINASRDTAQSITLPAASERYTLTAANLLDKQVQLNGAALQLGTGDALPELKGAATHPGQITFAPASISFLAVPGANNATCR
jgi:hypothetical protein